MRGAMTAQPEDHATGLGSLYGNQAEDSICNRTDSVDFKLHHLSPPATLGDGCSLRPVVSAIGRGRSSLYSTSCGVEIKLSRLWEASTAGIANACGLGFGFVRKRIDSVLCLQKVR